VSHSFGLKAPPEVGLFFGRTAQHATGRPKSQNQCSPGKLGLEHQKWGE
jgi:hypothetical protein